MKNKFQIKPQKYGFPSNIAGFNIKTITWKDFPAKPPQDTWFLAYTYWNTNYNCITKNGKSKALAKGFSPKSNKSPQNFSMATNFVFLSLENFSKQAIPPGKNYRLLQQQLDPELGRGPKHETGHYWIACQCALQFQKRVNYTEKQPQGIKFLEWCQLVFKKTSSQFAKQQKRYDKQTYHYLIQDEQQRWMKQMIAKFNDYNQFFEAKRKQEQKLEALIKVDSKQGQRRNTENQRGRGNMSLPVNKNPNTKNSKPSLNSNYSNNGKQSEHKKVTKQFSIRKRNIVQNAKIPKPNKVGVFDRAKNTLLGNIRVLEGLK